MMGNRVLRAVPYALLFAQVVLFFRLVVFAGYSIPWDLRGFHLPHLHLYSDALRAGELPLWDPYTYCGRPFQAIIQSAVFYPPMAAAAALGVVLGTGSLLGLLNLYVVAHVFLAGVFAYRLGRALGYASPAAYFFATVYHLGGFFAVHAEHLGAISVAAWLPFLLFSVVRMEECPRRGWLMATAGFAMSVLAGFTPLTALCVLATGLFALLRAALREGSWTTVRRTITAGAAALVLAALQIVPTFELTRHSIAQYRADWLGSGGGIPLPALISFVWPNAHGVFDPATYRQPFELTDMYLYSGIAGLVFAVVAAIRIQRHIVTVLFFVVTGVAMLGDSTPIGRILFEALPQQIQIGLQLEYALPVFLLAFAMLACAGLQSETNSPRVQWAVAAIAAVDLILVSSARPMNATPLDREPGISRNQFDGYAETLAAVRALVNQQSPPARIDGLNNVMGWAMSAPTTLVPNANGNDPMALARMIQVRLGLAKGERWGAYYEIENLASPLLGMMNVRYVVSRPRLTDEQLRGTSLTLVRDVPGYSIYRNDAVLPRFWLVSRIHSAQDLASAAERMRSPEFDPRREAVVEPRTLRLERPASDEPPGSVRVIHYSPSSVELEVEAARPSWLASSEAHYPGWQATIDGGNAELAYTNVAFRGMAVPAGRHRIKMQFRPASLAAAGALSVLGWIVWLWFWLRERRRSETRSPA